MTRNPGAARLPEEAEAAYGDLTIPATVEECVDGTDTVFLIWTALRSAAGAAVERIAKHAGKIVYLSAPLKTPHPFFQQPNPVRAFAEHLEGLIKASALPCVFLRPGIFAANALHWWRPQIGSGVVRWPYLAAATAPIDERDIARVAVKALCEDQSANAEYVLTGPESLTQFEQISAIGRALGRPLRIEEISPADWRRDAAGWPEPVVTMLLDAWAASIGHSAYITSTVEEVTGTPARTFFEWAGDHAAEFRAANVVA